MANRPSRNQRNQNAIIGAVIAVILVVIVLVLLLNRPAPPVTDVDQDPTATLETLGEATPEGDGEMGDVEPTVEEALDEPTVEAELTLEGETTEAVAP